jgi:hypothetical protein
VPSRLLVTCLGVAAPIVGVSASETDAAVTPPAQSELAKSELAKSELEMDISGNGSNMTMGEPQIAVNPVKPNELYVGVPGFMSASCRGRQPLAHWAAASFAKSR